MDFPAYQPVAPAAEGASIATPAVGPDRVAARPSLSELFASEEGPLLSYALGLVGRRSVGEELVQDAFLRLHQVWREVENPRAWLYRSVRNLALNTCVITDANSLSRVWNPQRRRSCRLRTWPVRRRLERSGC